MESRETLNYIKENINEIYNNFNVVFNINIEEFSNVIKKIVDYLSNEKFYQRLLNNNKLAVCFDEDSLLKSKKYLLSLSLTDVQIKKIILTLPQILLFANIDKNIFSIYKNNDLKGFAFVDDNDYKSYSLFNNNSNLFDDILENYDVNNYDYLVNEMLKSLKREDVVKNLNFNVNDDVSLITKFDALTKEYSKKNYYFKKRK